MASGFEVVKLELSFGRDKLDEWLIAELDRDQYTGLSLYQAKKGKAQTVDAVLAAIEASAEKRGNAAGADDDDDEGSDPYDRFKMRIVGDKLTAEGRLAGDETLAEAFLLAAVSAKAAEMGGKGELVLLGAKGQDGAERNLKVVAQKGAWSETPLSAAQAKGLRG
jgi:hypothetical protein